MSNDHPGRGDDPAAANPLVTWLEALGLERYAPAMQAQGIDLRSLPLLSESDLAELGVLLGHRKLLRKALSELDAGAPSREGSLPRAGMPPTEPGQAERRQITVMFCDLVGSTTMANQLDPEALRDLMHAYQQACGSVIEKYEGHVAQYLGDGLMSYFGWPRAHEDDAERAVHAAREIVTAVKRVPAPDRLQVRIGIATGPVVVGDTGAGDASVPKAAVGPTPNLAARLQSLAGADQIVVAPSTRRLLGHAFQYEDLGEHTLKGIAEPVHASRVVDVGKVESRFEAARTSGLTRFVGREQEVGELLARWQRACAGDGQVVLLAGEAGIGKSRITQVLRERLAEQPHTRLRYQCSPYHSGSAFHPIITQLERAAGFERDDAQETRLDKLESTLVFEPDRMAAVAPLFAALLSLPTERYPAQMLSPQKQRELTMSALVDQALNLAARQPVLMIVEDLHWVDPSTLESLGLLVGRIRNAPILLVLTHRPEFVSPWGAEEHLATLGLQRLSHDEGAAIVGQMSGGKALPAAVLAQIVAKTDGVPLFVEELTKTVLEAGFLRDAGDRYVVERPLPPLAIPSTLQDSLMARLDRLSPVKEVAQIGACIGREFSYALLAAVLPMPGEQLQTALDQLVASELMFCRGEPPEATYSFKHALVQDSAYASLLKSRPHQVHGRIARALEDRFPEVAKSQPELLALHLTQAGLVDEALPRWLGAAQLAVFGSRHREALGHVEAGLAIVQSANPGRRYNLEVALLTTGAVCHFALSGYASTAAAELFVRIEALLDRVTDRDVLMSALLGSGACSWVAADFRKAIATYEKLGAVAESAGDTDHLVLAYAYLGAALHNGGQFARARSLLEFVVQHYEVDKHFRHLFVTGQDTKSIASTWLGDTCLWCGYPDQARRHVRLGVEHSRAIAHPFSLSLVLAVGVITHVESGAFDEASRVCGECFELCDAQSLPYWKGWALVMEGVSSAKQGRYPEAAERLPQAMAYMRAAGARTGEPYGRAWLSIALAHQGRFEEARRESDAGRAECLRSSELMWLPTATYARAVADLLDPDVDDASAEHWFRTAIDECRAQGNRWLELRYATALARLWHSQGNTHEARELLAPIHGWFSEGFDTTDLKDAKALLDQIAAGR